MREPFFGPGLLHEEFCLRKSLEALRIAESKRASEDAYKPHAKVEKNVGLVIPSKPGDPNNFKNYFGQVSIKTRLALRLNAMEKGESLKALFSAPAGIGKTALARVVAHEMVNRKLIDNYFEFVAGKFADKKELDRFMRTLPPHSYVFIDEIHGLNDQVRDLLLPAIQDGLYAYSKKATMELLPEGISWVGATTDLGKVHAALQRRMNVVQLDAMGEADRIRLVTSLKMNVTKTAAQEIARRTWTPWEVKDEVFATARDIALYRKRKSVILDHALEAMALLGIDDNGLKIRDRLVIDALFNSVREVGGELRYGMSARALVAVTGLDMPTYLDVVEPKLLRLGFVRVSTLGRELTPKSLETYYAAI